MHKPNTLNNEVRSVPLTGGYAIRVRGELRCSLRTLRIFNALCVQKNKYKNPLEAVGKEFMNPEV